MSARQFLESYGDILDRAGRLEREALLCRRYARQQPDNPRWAARAEDLEGELRKARRLGDTRKREIEEKIACLENPAEALVLSMRYLGRYTYDEIAEVSTYSPRHIQRLHVQAVGRLEIFMDTGPCANGRCR
ncbi:MAG TPA: sigma factor-like helix-turn-helix DNA-binding protein [Candidatus Limnocylindria bacterium]|nr:sigma factor-like helix-turn-helix DNA-binding protein [Candidatus Limnocylindria bacterium]